MKIRKKARKGHRSSWDAAFKSQLRELDVELAEIEDYEALLEDLSVKYADNDSGQSGAVSVEKTDKYTALYLAGELDEDPVDVFRKAFNLSEKTATNSVTGFIRLLNKHVPDLIEG